MNSYMNYSNIELLRIRSHDSTLENENWKVEKMASDITSSESCCRMLQSFHLSPMNVSSTSNASFSVKVPHVRQQFNWDCGLACVLMTLKTFKMHSLTLPQLYSLCGTRSVWTVDLAHLLRKFCMDVIFLTVTIGANPNFALESFYKEHMNDDLNRVNGLFDRASQDGICIKVRSISGEELSMLILSGNFLAIALVDKRKLIHPWCDFICLTQCYGTVEGYTGHYVVICGYDSDSNEFEIRDPASSCEISNISRDVLDGARKAFGTDEDILLISLKSAVRFDSSIPM